MVGLAALGSIAAGPPETPALSASRYAGEPQRFDLGLDAWRSDGAEPARQREPLRLAAWTLQDPAAPVEVDGFEEAAPAGQSGGAAPSSQRSLPPFHRLLGRDLADLVRLPAHMRPRQWGTLGLAVLGIGATHLLDDEIRDQARRSSTSSDRLVDDFRPLANGAGVALLGLAWIGGRASHHQRLRRTAEDGFEAMILASGIITPALKKIVGRDRPNAELGSASFTGGESFPSGEVTQAFMLASVFSRHYPQRWVDGLSWSLAGVIAWQRLESDAHWTSDVVAGALTGTAVGRWVVGRNDTEHWSVAPDLEPGRRQVGVLAHYAVGAHVGSPEERHDAAHRQG